MIGKIVDGLLDAVQKGGFELPYMRFWRVLISRKLFISRKRALSAMVRTLGKQDDEENVPAIIAGRVLVHAISINSFDDTTAEEIAGERRRQQGEHSSDREMTIFSFIPCYDGVRSSLWDSVGP